MGDGSPCWARCVNWATNRKADIASVGETAAALKVDQLIAIGNVAATIAEASKQAGLENSSIVESTAEAAELLAEIAAPGDLVLIKGSRLARTEQVIEAFRNSQSIVANSP